MGKGLIRDGSRPLGCFVAVWVAIALFFAALCLPSCSPLPIMDQDLARPLAPGEFECVIADTSPAVVYRSRRPCQELRSEGVVLG